MEFEAEPLDRAERFVDVPQAPARRDPFDRDAAEAAAKLNQNSVLERVQRCKVDVATLGFDDLVAPVLLEQRSNAKAGTRSR
jgi:hypothetical protein